MFFHRDPQNHYLCTVNTRSEDMRKEWKDDKTSVQFLLLGPWYCLGIVGSPGTTLPKLLSGQLDGFRAEYDNVVVVINPYNFMQVTVGVRKRWVLGFGVGRSGSTMVRFHFWSCGIFIPSDFGKSFQDWSYRKTLSCYTEHLSHPLSCPCPRYRCFCSGSFPYSEVGNSSPVGFGFKFHTLTTIKDILRYLTGKDGNRSEVE